MRAGRFLKLGCVTGCRIDPIMGLEISVLYELHLLPYNEEKQANGIVMSVYSRTPRRPSAIFLPFDRVS
jgi:hypothetical protein